MATLCPGRFRRRKVATHQPHLIYEGAGGRKFDALSLGYRNLAPAHSNDSFGRRLGANWSARHHRCLGLQNGESQRCKLSFRDAHADFKLARTWLARDILEGIRAGWARGVDGQGRLSFVQTTSPGARKPRSTFTWYVRGSPGTGSSMSCPSVTGTWPRCTVITTLAGTWEQPGPNTATTATTDPTSFSRFVHGPGTDRTS